MNNWHRKMWTLDAPGPQDVDYQKVFKPGASNEFWLEPAVYTGLPVAIVAVTGETNTLCYRVQFDDENMNDVWRGLDFFPFGTQALSIDSTGNPQPVGDTERLQATTKIQGVDHAISLYLVPGAPLPGEFLVFVSDLTAPPGGDGWGGGHN